MFAPTRYLLWARRFYGNVRFDLATSGMPTVPLAELGMPDATAMGDPSGWTAARAAIASYHGVPPSEATLALGTTHAIWLAYAALTSPGDEILVETPAYEPLVRIAEGMGLRVAHFERPATERFALDPERVVRALTPRTRVVVVTNLHNPSGVRAPDDVLRATATALASRGATLLVDEVYAPFDALVDARGVFHGSARRLGPNVVAIGSLTKCYGLGPQRIGWLLGSPEVVARADDAVTASCGILPLETAHIAAHAFGCIVDLATRARAVLEGKREHVAAWALRHGLSWSAPTEGLYGFATVPDAGDLTAAIERAAQERDVLVAPGSFFGVPAGFRLSWSKPLPELDEGLARLAAALDLRAH
ncbi:MAG TPA: pyridoxal phosphate-dependent aminotransferase [Polyangiaceae bacterium]